MVKQFKSAGQASDSAAGTEVQARKGGDGRVRKDSGLFFVRDPRQGRRHLPREHFVVPAAAVGFLRGLEGMLAFAAEHCDHQGHFERLTARARAFEQREAEREANEKVEFVARMKAAKAIKKARVA